MPKIKTQTSSSICLCLRGAPQRFNAAEWTPSSPGVVTVGKQEHALPSLAQHDPHQLYETHAHREQEVWDGVGGGGWCHPQRSLSGCGRQHLQLLPWPGSQYPGGSTRTQGTKPTFVQVNSA